MKKLKESKVAEMQDSPSAVQEVQHPEIYFPFHLINQENLHVFPFGYMATTPVMLLVCKSAFNFTWEECEIYNELCNTDTVWLNKKKISPMETFFGKGKRLGIHGEAVFMMLFYMFSEYDYDGEEWEHSKEIQKLISGYKQRIVKEHETPQEWLHSIFSIGNSHKTEERIRHLTDFVLTPMDEIETLWSSRD